MGSVETGDPAEFDRLVKPVKLACSLFGCWPQIDEVEGKPGLFVLGRRLHRGFVLLLLIVTSAGTACDGLRLWGEDVNETIECSLVASALCVAVLRVLVFGARQSELLFVVETMRRDWSRASTDERRILRDKCLLSYKLAKLFCISLALTALSFVFGPVLELKFSEDVHKRVLPYRGYYFFNHTESPIFECLYIINAIGGSIGCSTVAGATSFSLLSTMHAAAKFALLQKEFEVINASDWTSNKKVGKCVQRHRECIRLAENIEAIIHFLSLAQFILSTGLLCLAGFQLTTMLKDRARLTKYATFLQAATMELFIFSFSGQNLKTESENIAEYIYSSNWNGCTKPSNIQLILMRSRKPCVITVGKFYDMSLQSFLKVLQSSFSYFTVLLAMNKEN